MNSFRISVIEILQLIALKAEQIDLYEMSEDRPHIPELLLNKWEEVYRPDKEGFNSDFSESELKQLNCFTDFFLARTSSFPAEFKELLKDPYWNSVCEFAGQILQDFQQV